MSLSISEPDCVFPGELVATYHYREAETEKAPAIVGATALLAGSEADYRVRPCGYRSAPCCYCVTLLPSHVVTTITVYYTATIT